MKLLVTDELWEGSGGAVLASRGNGRNPAAHSEAAAEDLRRKHSGQVVDQDSEERDPMDVIVLLPVQG